MAGVAILDFVQVVCSLVEYICRTLNECRRRRRFRAGVTTHEKEIIRSFSTYVEHVKNVHTYVDWDTVVDRMTTDEPSSPPNIGHLKVMNLFTQDVVDGFDITPENKHMILEQYENKEKKLLVEIRNNQNNQNSQNSQNHKNHKNQTENAHLSEPKPKEYKKLKPND